MTTTQKTLEALAVALRDVCPRVFEAVEMQLDDILQERRGLVN